MVHFCANDTYTSANVWTCGQCGTSQQFGTPHQCAPKPTKAEADLRAANAALTSRLSVLEAERDDYLIALALIESNEHGESYSAGVAMSALASVKEASDASR